ncbi:MAG: DUF2207 domain-containing protein [bacterium]|nr:DUF2207 domain-containing protein [bacterium]
MPVRADINEWSIKKFESEIILNKDSTATITENILADCGNCVGKHGIFRILPLQAQKTTTDIIKSPIKLQSITDFNNKPYDFQEIINQTDKTITWKIGDPNITVTGENDYRIKYIAKNVIRSGNTEFDEFYWNLNGIFWDLQTDNFTARIVFPPEVTSTGTPVVYLYGGGFGQNSQIASYKWGGNILAVESSRKLLPKEGITVSVTVPKNIFQPYILTKQDEELYTGGGKITLPDSVKKLFNIAGFSWPIMVLLLCYLIWAKYGRDPKINRAVAPEFEIPKDLSPIDMGMVDSNGRLLNHFISATIVNLAVKNYITIELIGKTGIFAKEDYKLRTSGQNIQSLGESEKIIYEKLFDGQSEILLSSLKNKFYLKLPGIIKNIDGSLQTAGLIKLTGNYIKYGLVALAVISLFGGFSLLALVPALGGGLLAGALIMLFFAFIMPSRTQQGAELELRIKGFKMYLETAEKYRQQFNEKENIFEKFLPYAMIFQLTKKWVKAMQQIYGEEYFNSYHPMWLQGALLTSGDFNLDHFETALESLSSNMASTIASSPSSSGAGGGGFSGGGGGGGGGRGW